MLCGSHGMNSERNAGASCRRDDFIFRGKNHCMGYDMVSDQGLVMRRRMLLEPLDATSLGCLRTLMVGGRACAHVMLMSGVGGLGLVLEVDSIRFDSIRLCPQAGS